MSQVARLTVFVFAVFVVLLFATGAYADSFTIIFSGTAPDGTSVSGNFNVTASPDSLGDGGYSVTSITSGSLTLEGSSYTVSGLTPLDGSPSPTFPGNDAYYICYSSTDCGYHYFSYDNLIYPGTLESVDSVLFYAGLGEPAELYCSSSGTCDLGVWVTGPNSVLSSLFPYPPGGNNPPDHGFEVYPVTIHETTVPTPEPSTLFLLGSGLGLGLLMLAGSGRRA